MGNSRSATTLLLLAIGLIVAIQNLQVVDGQCEGQLNEVVNNCIDYINPKADPIAVPSEECCEAYESLDVPCACNYLTKYPKSYGNVNRKFFVYAAADCGRIPNHGNLCGDRCWKFE